MIATDRRIRKALEAAWFKEFEKTKDQQDYEDAMSHFCAGLTTKFMEEHTAVECMTNEYTLAATIEGDNQ